MTKLPKAPLQEAIFEVRWDLDVVPETNQATDKGFDMALGSLRSLCKERFPHVVRKLPDDVPVQLFPYKTTYQYWTAENTWPLLQLGPGIFTINDTERNYEWGNNYYPLIKNGIKWLCEAYNQQLSFGFVALKYIDVVKATDYNLKKWPDFISDHLNFKFENSFNPRGDLKQFQFNQVFDQEDGSSLHLSISSGRNKGGEDIFIWQTSVLKRQSFTPEELINWTKEAHNIVSRLFKEICKPTFYDSFSATKGS
jgi:uncharacterized protein (TIGR04255 family)